MKTLRLSLLMLAAALMLTACDFYPVIIDIHVEDEAGHNLLDPKSEYFIGENVQAVYDGQAYPMDMSYLTETKVYSPHMFGLRLMQDRLLGYYHLQFGEFDGSESGDQTVTIVWPDGTSDTIYHKRVMFTPLAISDTWHLNGKHTSSPIVIVK